MDLQRIEMPLPAAGARAEEQLLKLHKQNSRNDTRSVFFAKNAGELLTTLRHCFII